MRYKHETRFERKRKVMPGGYDCDSLLRVGSELSPLTETKRGKHDTERPATHTFTRRRPSRPAENILVADFCLDVITRRSSSRPDPKGSQRYVVICLMPLRADFSFSIG